MIIEAIHYPQTIISFFRRLFSFLVLTLSLILVPAIAYALTDVTLAWDANSEPDVAGYNLYYGTASGSYSNSIDVGNTTQHTIPDLAEGVTYYFAATAYDVDNYESDYSAEVVYTANVTSHTIAASAGAHGSIAPSGSVAVANEANQSFSISADPSYQILEVLVDGVSVGAVGSYSFNTVTDNHTISASFTTVNQASNDSDGDGVPDDQDDFPYDAAETTDTDGDGQGNNADTDDDNDGMPDAWELVYGLNPLMDDAAADPDGDEVSNINEYHLGTEPDYNEGNFKPEPPVLLAPADYETIGLTPLLETYDFYDPNVNDVHGQTQWQIIRSADELCVFDVTTESSLTELTVPKLILDQDTDYIWRVKFIDQRGTASDWSEAGYFRTEFIEHDSDGNGIPDHQEVGDNIDIDGDGVNDREQADIKCIATDIGDFQIGISIRDSENVDSIVSIESEAPADMDAIPPAMGGANYLAFDLVHFKLIVNQPGDEVVVTIYLSQPAYEDGTWYKYHPVNDEWLDYSNYTESSADRLAVYLSIKDGGFGDVDGIENGIIVDPLALRTVANHNAGGSGSDSFMEEVVDGIIPEISCFISTAAAAPTHGQRFNLWREIRGRELSILFVLIVVAYFGRAVLQRIKRYLNVGVKGHQSWREAHKAWR